MRIASIGDVVMDLLVDVEDLPERGGAARIRSRREIPGGSCLNFSVAAARLGCRPTLVGAVGADDHGERLRAALAEEPDLRPRLREVADAETGLGVLVVDDGGERTILFDPGAYRRLAPADLDDDLLAGADLLHTTGYALAEEPLAGTVEAAIRRAVEEGTPVALDPSHGFAAAGADEHEDVLARADVLTPNREEAALLAGTRDPDDALERLQSLGPETVAITLGADGCAIAEGDEGVRVAGVPAEAADTTGAGDAFAAAYLAGRRHHGLSLEEAGLFANAAGALAATRRGGSAAMPTLNAVRRHLEGVNDETAGRLASKFGGER